METEVTVTLIAAGFAYLGFLLTKEAKLKLIFILNLYKNIQHKAMKC